MLAKPCLDQVQEAVRALQNVGTRMVTAGDPGRAEMKFPAEVVNALRSGFVGTKVYRFDMHFNSALATDGGGTLQRIVSWDPSVSSILEWSALSTLFDECLYGGSRLDLVSAFGPSSTAIVSMVGVAPDPNNSGTTYPTIQRLAESKNCHVYNSGMTMSFVHRGPIPNRPWAPVATPGGASGTPSGLFGRWAVANFIVATPSINYLFAALRVRAHLRFRA